MERVRELVPGEGEGTRRRAWSLRYYRFMTRASAVALALAAVFAVAHDSSGAEPEQPPSSSGAQSGPRQSPTEGDRKSTRRTPVTNAYLVCRLLLEKKKKKHKYSYKTFYPNHSKTHTQHYKSS